MARKRPAKRENVLEDAQEAWRSGRYRILAHAQERMVEREIIRPEVAFVILNGWWERKKDQFRDDLNSWTYAIRGKTLDDRALRVAIGFDEQDVLVVTLIDLERG